METGFELRILFSAALDNIEEIIYFFLYRHKLQHSLDVEDDMKGSTTLFEIYHPSDNLQGGWKVKYEYIVLFFKTKRPFQG